MRAATARDPLLIFLGLSRETIWRGDVHFAHIYQAKVSEKDTPRG
jgi:hypothetical protein